MRDRSRLTVRVRQGFTLIELLVVISILSVLMALLLPSLQSARTYAQQITCSSNLRQIGLTIFSYANDNRQYMPGSNWRVTSFDPNATSGSTTGWTPDNWPLDIRPYINAETATTVALVNTQNKVMQCPSTFRRNAFASYGLNRYAVAKANTNEWKYSRENCPRRLGADPLINRYPNAFMLGGESTFNNQVSTGPSGWGAAESGLRTLHGGTFSGAYYPSRIHNDMRNYILADGHVEAQSPTGKLFVINEASKALMANGGIQWGRNDTDQTWFLNPGVVPPDSNP